MGLTRRRRLLAISSCKVTVKTSIHHEVLDACASYWSGIQMHDPGLGHVALALADAFPPVPVLSLNSSAREYVSPLA